MNVEDIVVRSAEKVGAEVNAKIDAAVNLMESFMKQSEDKRRSKSHTRFADDDDGSDGSSSSSSSDDGRKGKKSGKGSGGKKRKDDSPSVSDNDSDNNSSEGSDSVFHGIASLRNECRGSAFKDNEEDDDDVDRALSWTGGRSLGARGMPDAINVKPLPTRRDLYLDELQVVNLLAFQKKYQELQVNFKQPLYIANFFKDNILNRVQNKAKQGKYKYLLKTRGILWNGQQRLSNSQIWEVIKSIIEPQNSAEMKELLGTSVFDPVQHDRFKSAAVIESNFAEYINEMINYDTMFLAMLDLIVGKKSKKFLPLKLNSGSMRDSDKGKGLIQYYLQGCPNREVAWKFYIEHVEERKRDKIRTFDKFREVYFRALNKIEERLRFDKVMGTTFLKSNVDNPKPPQDLKAKGQRSRGGRFGHKKRGGFVHNVDGVDEEDNEAEYSEVESASDEADAQWAKAAARTTAAESVVAEVEHKAEDDFRETVSGDDEDDAEFLHNVVLDKGRGAACWKYADTGKCDFAKCRFSHHPDDVAYYKKMKDLRGQYRPAAQGVGATRTPGILPVNPSRFAASGSPGPKAYGDARRKA
jgi:hypothetical protein